MAVKHYYVSQQRGNDENDGLTPGTPWATLGKAVTSVVLSDDDHTYVNIGPGVYYESIISPNGASSTRKLIWRGDPDAVYVTGDIPGDVRITRCNTEGYPQTGRVLDWSGRSNCELWDVQVDGSSDNYAIANIPVSRRLKVISRYGVIGGVIYDSAITAAYYAVNGATAYNCRILAGNTAFYGGTGINCFIIAGYYGGYGGTVLRGCVVIGGYYNICVQGWKCYNCLLIGSSNGPSSNDNSYVSLFGNLIVSNGYSSSLGNYGFAENNLHVATNQVSGPSISGDCQAVYHEIIFGASAAKHVGFFLNEIPRNLFSISDPYNVIRRYGAVVSETNYAGSAIDLTSERIVAFTPMMSGKSVGISFGIASKSGTGNLVIELQKYTGGSWQTQKSVTKDIATVSTGTQTWFWDSGSGDNNLTTVASTWRYRFTATGTATATTLRQNGPNVPTHVGWCIPADIEANEYYGKDMLGRKRIGGFHSYTPMAHYELDWSDYHTVAPSIKFTRPGEEMWELPVKGGEAISVSYMVKHNGAAAGSEPLIRLAGTPYLSITEQVATHSAGANTWQQLTVTATPAFDVVLRLYLCNRDAAASAWFSAPTVS